MIPDGGRRAALAVVLAAAVALPGCADDATPGRAIAGLGAPLRPSANGSQPTGVERAVRFAGRRWVVRSSVDPGGPGPNRFANAADAVWVDAGGRLHLTLTRRGGEWWSTEVISEDAFGDGTYRWTIASPVAALNPNVVFGMFTWSPEEAPTHRELDVEIARWGDRADTTNAQFAVQPSDAPGHLRRLALHPLLPTAFEFTRDARRVAFRAAADPAAWTAPAAAPGGDAQVHINLWLFRGSAPTDGLPVEVIVSGFAFTPRGAP